MPDSVSRECDVWCPLAIIRDKDIDWPTYMLQDQAENRLLQKILTDLVYKQATHLQLSLGRI